MLLVGVHTCVTCVRPSPKSDLDICAHIRTDCTPSLKIRQHTFLLLGQLDTYESVITDEPARTRAL